MNKTTTALTDLINKIDKGMAALGSSDVSRAMKSALEVYKDEAISLLQKEREDMENVFTAGVLVGGFPEDIRPASDYFNDKFTQYKTTDNE